MTAAALAAPRQIGTLKASLTALPWMKWVIAGVIVVALLVAWVVVSLTVDRGPVTACPSGSVRVREHCIPT